MKGEEFLEVVRRFVEAFNRRDLGELGTFYSERGVREGPGFGRAEGKEAIRKSREGIFRAFPDLSLSYRHQFSVGSHGVLEWTLRGTHTGVLETPMGSIPATGKRVEFSGVTIFELDESGLIVRERVYNNMAELLGQLGVLKIAVPV